MERQVPVTRPATPAPPADPFAAPDGDANGSDSGDGGSNARNSEGEIDPRIVEWIGWYRASDMKADANGDGRVTAADFNAFLKLLNGDDDTTGNGDDSTDGSTGGGGDDDKSNNGGGDDGDDTNGDGDNGDNGDNGDDGAGDGDDGSDGGDAGSDGVDTSDAFWTELTPSSDSLVFYVAETGSDSNDGLSPNRPLRTVSEGLRRLRNGKPDWLLLRRGDVFSDTLGQWEKSGRAIDEKMVVGAYGEGPRPVLSTGTGKAMWMIKNDRRAHLAFVSLELRPGVKYQREAITLIAGGVEDVLFEDIKISGYALGVAMNGSLKDIAFRRCVIVDNAGWTRSQALYSEGVDGLLVEQCMFDRNGWRPDLGRDSTAG
ncbi:MAG: hypothetical protein AAGK78_12895, partial [Planctomycetota bacterium]